MSERTATIYNRTLQISVVALSAALFWFAFIYYPRVVGELRSGRALVKNPFLKPVAANHYNFPIQTSAYRISYEPKSNTYYVFVNGNGLEEFAYNRDNAKLALKTALSMENLCEVNVIYSSRTNLKVPQRYNDNSDC